MKSWWDQLMEMLQGNVMHRLMQTESRVMVLEIRIMKLQERVMELEARNASGGMDSGGNTVFPPTGA